MNLTHSTPSNRAALRRAALTLAAGSLFGLAACDFASDTSREVGNEPVEYDARVAALKAEGGPGYDAALEALRSEYGLVAKAPRVMAQVSAKPEAGPVMAALAKSSSALVKYREAGVPASVGYRRIFQVKKGGNRIEAEAIGKNGSDPMLFLIQFDDLSFREQGFVSSSAQMPFRIVAWNDDAKPGLRNAKISWTAPADDRSFYMLIALPYSTSSGGVADLKFSQKPTKGGCGTKGIYCDPKSTLKDISLAGAVIRPNGGNTLSTSQASSVDPWLFAFTASNLRGISNDDATGRESRVYFPEYAGASTNYDFTWVSAFAGSGTVMFEEALDCGSAQRVRTPAVEQPEEGGARRAPAPAAEQPVEGGARRAPAPAAEHPVESGARRAPAPAVEQPIEGGARRGSTPAQVQGCAY